MALSKKVLVIENDEVIVVLISHILSRQSYIVHSTGAIQEADRLLMENQYDAVLLEPKIPEGGVDYIRRLESVNPALVAKIIVVTADVHDIPSLAGLPIHSVVRKPFEVHELLETVRRCVEM